VVKRTLAEKVGVLPTFERVGKLTTRVQMIASSLQQEE